MLLGLNETLETVVPRFYIVADGHKIVHLFVAE